MRLAALDSCSTAEVVRGAAITTFSTSGLEGATAGSATASSNSRIIFANAP